MHGAGIGGAKAADGGRTSTRDGDKAVAILYGSGIVHADGACGGGGADVSSADAEVLHDACLCTVVGIDAESMEEGGVSSSADVESADEVALPVESTGVRVGGSTDGRPGFGIGGGGSGIAGVGTVGAESEAGVEVNIGAEAGVFGIQCIAAVVEAVGKEAEAPP